MGIQPSAKETQHARQQTASSVLSAMGKAQTGEPQGIVVVGNGQRPEACSAEPCGSHKDTDRAPCLPAAPDVHKAVRFWPVSLSQ